MSSTEPPKTGLASVDAVLAGLGEMGELSAAERLAKLRAAQEELARALDGSADAAQAPLPAAEV